MADTSKGFQPYVPATESMAEFTAKAIILGVLFGLLFGASTVYLGLRAGLTVSASIPIAVLAISVLKKLGGSTILENNIVQTIGSAGESVAGGVVFTIPALIFLLPDGPKYFNYTQITMLAFAGGILGVLMMVPLRRALIVKEHGVLPYPEGTACAEVLVAGERGGKLAGLVFSGLGIGALWKSLSWTFNIFRQDIGYSLPRTSQFPNATLNVDISPEYMGVGYVIGPRIAGTMFAGGVLSWLVLLPLISLLGANMTRRSRRSTRTSRIQRHRRAVPDLGDEPRGNLERLYPLHRRRRGARRGLDHAVAHAADDRLVGARRLEGIWRGGAGAQSRTERDIPMTVVLGGSLLLAIFLAVTPGLPTQGNILVSILIVLFGFFFATVSSRITGLIGSSSNPISGMTIATLIITCVIFVALGWTGDVYGPVALSVGAIVCICAANAGNTSQDLKTGYIVGATPIYQQMGLAIGVVTSAFIIGYTVLALHNTFGIGSEKIAAPQATLMATLIKGLLSQNLPWGLVLVGVFISVTLELCGIHSLSFAVGAYLPIATTAPIFAGGLVRWLVERKTGETSDSDLSSGTLFSSGLIAGGSLAGILFAALVGYTYPNPLDPTTDTSLFEQYFLPIGNVMPWLHEENTAAHIAGAVLFLVLAVILSRFAKRKI